MHANESSPSNTNDARDISVDLYPFLRQYKDGSIERFLRSPLVAASSSLEGTNSFGVATRDVVIDKATGVSARLFLPCRAAGTGRRLPLVIYVHGGSFCTESAFCRTYHRYATLLAARAGAVVVSVDYRLAPEFPIPAAYDDVWTALRWVASFSDPWLAEYADPGRTFLAGDSAGGNIVYHTAVRASYEDNDDMMDIEGLIMVQPYFWGTERLPSELSWDSGVATMFLPNEVDRLWPFVTAGKDGNDDPRINPPDEEVASLACRRVLVAVAGMDTLRDRGRRLADRMRDNHSSSPLMIGRRREVTVVESEGQDHGFHLYSPLHETSRTLMESMAQFINQPRTSSSMVIGVPTTPFMDVFGSGWAMKNWSSTPARSSAAPNNSFRLTGVGAAHKKTNISFFGRMQRGNATQTDTLSAAVPWRSVIKNFYY